MPTFKVGFLTITIIDIIDIVLVTWIFFKVYQYFKETRAGQMLIGLIILLISSFIFNTEISSNMATTAMLLPIMIPLSEVIGVHPYLLLVSTTLAASCAFMLPVATPPNAVVFGSKLLTIRDMVKAGF